MALGIYSIGILSMWGRILQANQVGIDDDCFRPSRTVHAIRAVNQVQRPISAFPETVPVGPIESFGNTMGLLSASRKGDLPVARLRLILVAKPLELTVLE